MVRNILLIFSCIALKAGIAQTASPEVISTSGSSFTVGGSQLDWTLGETSTATLSLGSSMASQGFHQPSLVVTEVEIPETDYTLTVFPNPTADVVQLSFHALKGNVSIELFSSEGKLLHAEQGASISRIDMQPYAAGSYYLSVKAGQQPVRKYTIIKSR